MPALVNSSVGSLPGTRLEEATTVWSRSLKKLRNALRTCAALMKGGFWDMCRAKGLVLNGVAAQIALFAVVRGAFQNGADMIR